jgi:hypothetical protein
VVAAFSGPIDVAKLKTHVTVTATPAGGGAAVPVDFDLQTTDGVTVNIVAVVVDNTMTPPKLTPTNWPASSKIDVAIDATTVSVAGDTLGAAGAASGTFTTSAM